MKWNTLALGLTGAAMVALAAATLIRLYAQPAPASYFAYDQRAYLSMANAPLVNTADTYLPASWRVLPPLVARLVGQVTGLGSERGFLILTFACFALIPIAAGLFLRDFGASDESAITGAALMAVAPPVVGYLSWDVVRVDALSLLLLFLVASAVVRCRPVTLVVLIVALAFSKETAFIGVAFATAWATLVERRMLPAAIVCAVLTLLVRTMLLPWLVADPRPFDNLAGMKGMIDAFSGRYAFRRLLLATAATWNVLLPIAAVGLTREWRTARGAAVLLAIVVASTQILFASDTQRLVAAGYPFVLVACAFELDRIDAARRSRLAIALLLGQLPWLLEYGRIVHIPPLRVVEIVLVLITGAAVVWRVRQDRVRYFSPPKTAWPANVQ